MSGAACDCPRCGYDFSGVIASWKESCPVQGVCTECGLEMWWGDVLVPERRVPAWSVEQVEAGRLWGVARALIGTQMRALRPGRFWSAMRMEFAFSARRLMLLMAWGVVSMYLVFFVGFLVWMGLLDTTVGAGPCWEWMDDPERVRWVVWPRTLLGEADVRSSSQVAWYLRSQAPVVAWWLLAATLLVPVCFALLPETLQKAKVLPRHVVRIWAYGMPVAIAILTLPWVVADVLEAGMELRARWSFMRWIPWYSRWDDWEAQRWRVVTVLLVAWLGWWWWCACVRFLRLVHARRVACVLVILSLLAACVPCVLIGSLSVPWWNALVDPRWLNW